MATQNAARPLRDAVRRIARTEGADWAALALHIARLPPPAPRPYHLRIARAVLDDAAARQGGNLFPLGNGDLVLLWRTDDGGAALAGHLARLFAADAPNPALLLTRWRLDEGETEPFLAYVDHCDQEAAARPPPPSRSPAEPSLTTLEALAGAVETVRLTDLLHRQTAVRITAAGLEPIYRAITCSAAVLAARAGTPDPAADPLESADVAHKLGERTLREFAADLRGDRLLLGWAAGQGGPMLHLSLSLPAVLSPSFDAFATACREVPARVAIELRWLDAFADPDGFALACGRMRLAGFGFVLGGFSSASLPIASPRALNPDLLRLQWSPALAESETGLAELEPDRVVLHGVDDGQGLSWGLRHGVRRFQGRQVDLMLAAGRVSRCPHAGFCTVLQCTERERATSKVSRAGCRNLALLDAAS
jgi:hypothetical protein